MRVGERRGEAATRMDGSRELQCFRSPWFFHAFSAFSTRLGTRVPRHGGDDFLEGEMGSHMN